MRFMRCQRYRLWRLGTAYHDGPMMQVQTATDITGGTSAPGKMPGHAWSLSAHNCKTGAQLAAIPGTVCNECYALQGRYRFPAVQAAQSRRLTALKHPQWVPAMARLAGRDSHFRWFDAGDLQSDQHLAQIVAVALLTPDTHHWLPTREVNIVARYRKHHTIPPNLIIRISGNWIDGQPPVTDLPRSIVSRNRTYPTGYKCPAKLQDNRCSGPLIDCRACWSTDTPLIIYPHH
jgi:hypothetical protein